MVQHRCVRHAAAVHIRHGDAQQPVGTGTEESGPGARPRDPARARALKFHFRLEAFNLFNTVNYNTPNRFVNTPQFGTITEAATFGAPDPVCLPRDLLGFSGARTLNRQSLVLRTAVPGRPGSYSHACRVRGQQRDKDVAVGTACAYSPERGPASSGPAAAVRSRQTLIPITQDRETQRAKTKSTARSAIGDGKTKCGRMPPVDEWRLRMEGQTQSPRSRRVSYGLTKNNGPCKSGKLPVFRTWIPALCSPLNGVVSAGQPAFLASSDELNQRPR